MNLLLFLKHKSLVILLLGASALLWIILAPKKKSKEFVIGIIQTASHPALDTARQGFVQELERLMPGKVEFILKNVQGEVSQAYTVAKSLNNNSEVNALFAIATLAAQAAKSTQTTKPITIAAVTDPIEYGIWAPQGLVCGSSDKIDVTKQLELLNILMPSLRRIGILYSLPEANSVTLVKNMKEALLKKQIEIVDFGITQPTDLPLVVSRIQEVDLVWVPTDNGVATALDIVIKKLKDKKVPLMLSDNLLMKEGVLCTAGVDYKEAGRQAAQSLEKILVQKKKPYELTLQYPDMGTLTVNKKTADSYGIIIPPSTALIIKE